MNVIITDDEDVTICRIIITKLGTGNQDYEYHIDTEDQGIETNGEIYNHQGDYLNLLEKILHGRNVS